MVKIQGTEQLLGICRMGTDSRTSVVDSIGRSHDHGNLLIMGANVILTSSTANPTLTIAALNLRITPEIFASVD